MFFLKVNYEYNRKSILNYLFVKVKLKNAECLVLVTRLSKQSSFENVTVSENFNMQKCENR